jgi:hypothetical protein
MSVSDVFFILENRSPHAIYFQATKYFWSSTAYPVYTALECTYADPFKGNEYSSFPLIDFRGGPPPFIEVSPGNQLRLDVVDRGDDIAKHRGDVCSLRLLLRNNDQLVSKPFSPRVSF